MGKSRMENSLIMFGVLFFALITLGSATANNVSSKPRDNKVSSLRRVYLYYIVSLLED